VNHALDEIALRLVRAVTGFLELLEEILDGAVVALQECQPIHQILRLRP